MAGDRHLVEGGGLGPRDGPVVLRAPRAFSRTSVSCSRAARASRERPASTSTSLRRDAVCCGVPLALDALHVCLEGAQVVAA